MTTLPTHITTTTSPHCDRDGRVTWCACYALPTHRAAGPSLPQPYGTAYSATALYRAADVGRVAVAVVNIMPSAPPCSCRCVSINRSI
jgi:hypothetical protein